MKSNFGAHWGKIYKSCLFCVVEAIREFALKQWKRLSDGSCSSTEGGIDVGGGRRLCMT